MLYQSNQKAKELRHRACKLFKAHAPNEVPSHKKNLRQLGIQQTKKKKKNGRGPSNYRVWKRKRRVIRSWGAAVCVYLGASSPSPTLASPHSTLSFLSSSSLFWSGPTPPRGCRGRSWVSDRWELTALLQPGPAAFFCWWYSLGSKKGTAESKALGARVAEDWGFCGLVEIQRPLLWGVSGLACGKAKLKSSWAARRVKREGSRETRGWLEQHLTHPIYNTSTQRFQCYLWCFNTKILAQALWQALNWKGWLLICHMCKTDIWDTRDIITSINISSFSLPKMAFVLFCYRH